jgi:transposase-like protein
MTKPIARDPIYRRRVFDADVIELCVRWYITYRFSFGRGRRRRGWSRKTEWAMALA